MNSQVPNEAIHPIGSRSFSHSMQSFMKGESSGDRYALIIHRVNGPDSGRGTMPHGDWCGRGGQPHGVNSDRWGSSAKEIQRPCTYSSTFVRALLHRVTGYYILFVFFF